MTLRSAMLLLLALVAAALIVQAKNNRPPKQAHCRQNTAFVYRLNFPAVANGTQEEEGGEGESAGDDEAEGTDDAADGDDDINEGPEDEEEDTEDEGSADVGNPMPESARCALWPFKLDCTTVCLLASDCEKVWSRRDWPFEQGGFIKALVIKGDKLYFSCCNNPSIELKKCQTFSTEVEAGKKFPVVLSKQGANFARVFHWVQHAGTSLNATVCEAHRNDAAKDDGPIDCDKPLSGEPNVNVIWKQPPDA